MNWEDEGVGTLSGAGSGALTGASIGALGGPGGATAGALIGGGLGAVTGFFRGRSSGGVKKAMQQSRKELAELQRTQRAQRESDLSRALAYFKPAQAVMNRSWKDYNPLG